MGGEVPDLGFHHVHEPGTGDATVTALLLHGTGADEHDLVPLGRELFPDQALLSPRGKVLEAGRVHRWFRRLEEGVFDEESIRENASELARFVGDARDAYPDDPDATVALGFSNGANIASSLLLLHPDVLDAAVLLRPMTPLEPDALPDLAGVPVYMASGGRDPMVPADDPARLATMLREAGADVTHRVEETAGHGLGRGELEPVKRWVRERVDGLADPP